MTKQEAINRIERHMIIHKLHEPRAVYITEALQMAINSLKAQEPIRPEIRPEGENYGSRWAHWYACGACHCEVNVGAKYCQMCGREVKWE